MLWVAVTTRDGRPHSYLGHRASVLDYVATLPPHTTVTVFPCDGAFGRAMGW